MSNPDDFMAARARSFDEVPELYQAARPGYPEELFETIVSGGRLEAKAPLLEIGCGPGTATASFARRGFRIVALEPGPALARIAGRNLAAFPEVQILNQRFEDWPLEREGFDLVYAAQSFHLIAPATRVAKAARALRPGGLLALFGNRPLAGDPGIRGAIQRAYQAHAPELASNVAPAAWPPGPHPFEDECRGAGVFGSLECFRFAWSRPYTAAQYGGLLRTFSDHRMLPPARLEALVEQVERAIAERGGTFEVPYVAWLVLSRRSR
jgi:SAM-dependent methyltransferase